MENNYSVPEYKVCKYIDWRDLKSYLKHNNISDMEIKEFYYSINWQTDDEDNYHGCYNSEDYLEDDSIKRLVEKIDKCFTIKSFW